MQSSETKLQRLLARQRALDAQIKAIQDKERQRQEQAISYLVRRYRLHRFDPEKLDLALARLVDELEAGVHQQMQPQVGEPIYGG